MPLTTNMIITVVTPVVPLALAAASPPPVPSNSQAPGTVTPGLTDTERLKLVAAAAQNRTTLKTAERLQIYKKKKNATSGGSGALDDIANLSLPAVRRITVAIAAFAILPDGKHKSMPFLGMMNRPDYTDDTNFEGNTGLLNYGFQTLTFLRYCRR